MDSGQDNTAIHSQCEDIQQGGNRRNRGAQIEMDALNMMDAESGPAVQSKVLRWPMMHSVMGGEVKCRSLILTQR